MSQSAIATRPAAPPSSTEAISAYVARAMARIDKTIGAIALVEPKVIDVDRAARLLGPLTETLVGLAMGTVVGGVASVVRQTLGGEMTAKVAMALAKRVARYEPRALPALALLDDSPSRSFREELAKRMRMRVAMLASDMRSMLMTVADVIAEGGPIEVRAFDRVLEKCADDAVIEEKFARDMQRGWDAWAAVITGTAVDGQTALWTLWSRRARNEREVLTPSTADVVAAGFIARIG